MTLVRRVARPLIAAPFIATGVDGLRHPGPRLDDARPVATRLAQVGGSLGLTDNPEVLVRANSGVMAGAGLLLATGRLPRLAGLILAASGGASTLVHYQFWTEKDAEQRQAERQQFFLRLGLVGAALLAAVDTDGRPGLAWRGRRAAKSAERTAKRAKREARRAARLAKAEARIETTRLARKAGDLVSG